MEISILEHTTVTTNQFHNSYQDEVSELKTNTKTKGVTNTEILSCKKRGRVYVEIHPSLTGSPAERRFQLQMLEEHLTLKWQRVQGRARTRSSKVAAEGGRKQRGPGGSFRGWTDCTETGGTTDLGGGDWSGFGWGRELQVIWLGGLWWLQCMGTCCPQPTAPQGSRQ